MADNREQSAGKIQRACQHKAGGTSISIARRAAANTGFVLLGQIVTKAVSVVVVLYLASYLGKTGFGKFNLAFAYLLFFAVIIDFGLDQIVIRELSTDREHQRKILGNAIIIKFCLAIISIAVLFALLPLFHYPASTRLLILIAAASLIFSLQSPSFGTVFTVIFTVRLERFYVTVVDSAVRLAVSAAVLYMAYIGRPLTEIVAVNAYGLLPGVLMMGYLSHKRIAPVYKPDKEMIVHLLKEAAPIAFASIFVMVYFRIDVILLSIWKTEAAIGDYASAYKLTEAFTMLGGAVVTTLLPVASRFYISADEALKKAYEISLKYLGVLMIPVAIGVAIFPSQIIKICYPHGGYTSAFALSVLIWAELFILWNMVLNTFLISIQKQNIALYITLGLVGVNVGVNAVLIPAMSFNGAAIATFITELIFTLTAGAYLFRVHGLKWPESIGRLVLANVLFAGMLWFVHDYNILLVVIPAALIYVGLLSICGVMTASEKQLIRTALSRGA